MWHVSSLNMTLVEIVIVVTAAALGVIVGMVKVKYSKNKDFMISQSPELYSSGFLSCGI